VVFTACLPGNALETLFFDDVAQAYAKYGGLHLYLIGLG